MKWRPVSTRWFFFFSRHLGVKRNEKYGDNWSRLWVFVLFFSCLFGFQMTKTWAQFLSGVRGTRACRLRKLKIKQGQGHRGSGKEREGNLQPVLLILRLERRQWAELVFGPADLQRVEREKLRGFLPLFHRHVGVMVIIMRGDYGTVNVCNSHCEKWEGSWLRAFGGIAFTRQWGGGSRC